MHDVEKARSVTQKFGTLISKAKKVHNLATKKSKKPAPVVKAEMGNAQTDSEFLGDALSNLGKQATDLLGKQAKTNMSGMFDAIKQGKE